MYIDDIDINFLIYYVGLDLRALSGDVFFSGYVVHRDILSGSDETTASHITPSPAPAWHSTPSPTTRPFFSPLTFVYPPPASVDPPPASDDPPPLVVPPPPASVAPAAPTADPSAPASNSTASTTVYVRSKRKKKT